MIGFEYGKEFRLTQSGKVMFSSESDKDKDFMMSDSNRNLNELKYYELECDKQQIIKQMFNHKMIGDKLFKKLFQFTTNSMIIDEKFHVYHITNYTESD
jgi:hypothetical protein